MTQVTRTYKFNHLHAHRHSTPIAQKEIKNTSQMFLPTRLLCKGVVRKLHRVITKQANHNAKTAVSGYWLTRTASADVILVYCSVGPRQFLL